MQIQRRVSIDFEPIKVTAADLKAQAQKYKPHELNYLVNPTEPNFHCVLDCDKSTQQHITPLRIVREFTRAQSDDGTRRQIEVMTDGGLGTALIQGQREATDDPEIVIDRVDPVVFEIKNDGRDLAPQIAEHLDALMSLEFQPKINLFLTSNFEEEHDPLCNFLLDKQSEIGDQGRLGFNHMTSPEVNADLHKRLLSSATEQEQQAFAAHQLDIDSHAAVFWARSLMLDPYRALAMSRAS